MKLTTCRVIALAERSKLVTEHENTREDPQRVLHALPQYVLLSCMNWGMIAVNDVLRHRTEVDAVIGTYSSRISVYASHNWQILAITPRRAFLA